MVYWSDAELRFALQATTDTAPTANKLRRWGLSQVDPAGILCWKQATIHHILNGFSSLFARVDLLEHHNSVLSAIKHNLTTFCEQSATQQAVQATVSTTAKRKLRFIRYIRPCETLSRNADPRRPLASQANLFQTDDWQFLFDLEEQLQFPVEIAVTTLRRDVVMFSWSKKLLSFSNWP